MPPAIREEHHHQAQDIDWRAPEQFAPNAVAHWARLKPQATAIQHVDGPAYSYAELDTLTNLWAGALMRQGVKAGSHVATFLPNGAEAHFAMLAIGRLRAVEIPVNTALVGRLLSHALGLADAEYVLTRRADLDRLLALEGELPRLTTIIVLDSDDLPVDSRCRLVGVRAFLDSTEPAKDLPGPSYRDTATIMFTSGTTGPSKGAIVTWALIAQSWTCAPPDMVPPGLAIYCPLPLVHNSGRTCLNYALRIGAPFVCRERFSGAAFWDDVRRYDCGAASLVGPLVQFLNAQPERPDDADNPLSSIFCGPLIPEIEAFKRRFGVKVMTAYGMTEIGIVLTTGWDHGPASGCGKVKRDYPFPEARIVDAYDEPVPFGQAGELIVRAREPWAFSSGYYNMPEQTLAAWRNGWFHTGDVMRQDEDGWFHLIDRLKDSIRRRGENISSAEVESLVRDFPGVIDCAAIAVPAEYGEDEIKAVVETADPAAFDPDAFFAWSETAMPRFMRPRYVEAVAALPRNHTSQRLIKSVLREAGLTPATADRERAGGRGGSSADAVGKVEAEHSGGVQPQ